MTKPQTSRRRKRLFKLGSSVALATIINAGVSQQAAAQAVWNGGGADNLWSNATNWTGTNISAGNLALQFAGTNQLASSNDFAAGFIVNGLTFNTGAGAFTLSGNTIKLASGSSITNSSANAQTIGMNLILTGQNLMTFGSTAGKMTFTGNITGTDNATSSIYGRGGFELVYEGVISNGAGTSVVSISRTDGGTITLLNPNNSFTGGISIATGAISASSISNGGVNSAIGAGTTISLGQSYAAGSSSVGRLLLTDAAGNGSTNRTININNGTSAPAQTVTNQGGGILDNSVVGGTATFSGFVTTNDRNKYAALTLQGAGNGILNNVIGNTAGTVSVKMDVSKLGAGTWEMNGANLYAGSTTVGAGTLKIGNIIALGSGGFTTAATTGGTSITSGATLDLNGQTNVNEVFTLNGTGVGANGALINNSTTAASIGNGIASITASSAGVNSAVPTVSITGGGGSGATAVATQGVTVQSFIINSGTTVYSVAPVAAISGGGGSGAIARAVLTGGVVTGIEIISMGSGFTSVPTIAFTGGTVTTAGTNPTGTGNATNFAIEIAVTNPGSGYTSVPTIGLSSGTSIAVANLSSVNLATSSSVGGSGDLAINAIISGPAAANLTKVGAGTVTLNAVNTYLGTTIINGGTLAVSGGNAIADMAAVTLANTAGATFQLNANETISVLGGGGTTGGNVNLQGFTLTSGGGTYNGTISGTGNFLKVSANTQTLTSTASTYSGTTTLQEGLLTITNQVLSGVAGPLGQGSSALVWGNATTPDSINGDSGNITFTVRNETGGVVNWAFERGLDGSALRGNLVGRPRFIFASNNPSDTSTLTLSGNVNLVPSGTGPRYEFVSQHEGMTLNITGLISGAGNIMLWNGSNQGIGTIRLANANNSYTGANTVVRGALIVAGNVGASGSSPIGTQGINLGGDGAPLSVVVTAGIDTKPGLFMETAGTTFARAINLGTVATYSGNNGVPNGYRIGGLNSSGVVTFSGNVNSNGNINGLSNLALFSAGGGEVNFSGILNDVSGTQVTRVTINQFINHPDLVGGSANVPVGTPTTGSVVLSGANTYEGGTTVRGGALLVRNLSGSATGTGAVLIDDNAALGGNGSISGNVTFNANTVFSPGSVDVAVGVTDAQTITLGGLALNATTNSYFDLGTSKDLVNVTNDLVLNGIINIRDSGGFANGTYTLFDYNGTRSGAADSSFAFGLAPAGFNLEIVTDTVAKQVNLVVGQGGLLYWDGSNTTANNLVDGGSADWVNSVTNWTNQNGNVNSAWTNGLTAVFKDTDVNSSGGAVNVTEDFEVAGLQFGTSGYTLTDGGGSFVVNSGETAQLLVDNTVNANLTATIAAPLTGLGGIRVTGGGVLILSGANTYENGTTINSATLQVSSDQNLGASTGGLVFEGPGTLRTTTGFSSDRPVTFTAAGTFDVTSGTLLWNGNMSGLGGLTKAGSASMILAGTLAYDGDTTVNDGVLQFDSSTSGLTGNLITNASAIFNSSVADTFAGDISGTGSILKIGAGNLTLTGALTLSGTATIQSGMLTTGSLPNASLQVSGGTFNLGGVNVGVNVVVQNLGLNGGSLLWDIGNAAADTITVSSGLATLNAATLFAFNNVGFEDGTYSLIKGLAPTWNLDLLSYTGLDAGTFVLSGDGKELFFSSYSGGGVVSGSLLQNSAPINIASDADFMVLGAATTGTPTENNVINSLIFTPDSSLRVYNELSVTSGNFTVDLSTATLLGDKVVTPDDFTKLGAGTLNVEAAVLVNGNANVSEGSLRVNGTFAASQVNVANGALLGGNGRINGGVFNRGTVAPGNSIGTLRVDGNYTQTTAGALEIEIAGRNDFDRLIVSGVARLDGSLVVINDGPEFKYGDSFSFLEADEIRGGFTSISLGTTVVRGRFVNAADTGSLVIAPASYVQMARTQNQRNVARALDEWIDESEGDAAQVSLALDQLSAEEYSQAFESIAPGYYEGAVNTGIELSHNQGQLLHQQLSARRLGQRAGQNRDELGQRSYPEGTQYLGASSKGAKYVEPVSVVEDPRWSTWVQGSGLFSSGGLSLTPGESFESGTFMVGADYAVNDHFAVGFFAGYQEGWGDYDNGGSLDLESVRFGLYATVDFGGFYAHAAVGGGTNSYDVKRPVVFEGLDRNARSEPDGTEFFALLGTGYDFTIGNLTFGPQVSAQYTKIKFGTFSESGAGSLSLRVQDVEAESLRTYLGGRIAYNIRVNDNVSIIPELRVFWKHEFLNGSENLRANLDAGSGPAFDYLSTEPERDTVYAGAGIGFQIGPRFYGNVYYNADFGRNSEDINHTVSISGTWKF